MNVLYFEWGFDLSWPCQYAFIGWAPNAVRPIILVMSESFIKYTIFPNIYKMKVYFFLNGYSCATVCPPFNGVQWVAEQWMENGIVWMLNLYIACNQEKEVWDFVKLNILTLGESTLDSSQSNHSLCNYLAAEYKQMVSRRIWLCIKLNISRFQLSWKCFCYSASLFFFSLSFAFSQAAVFVLFVLSPPQFCCAPVHIFTLRSKLKKPKWL